MRGTSLREAAASGFIKNYIKEDQEEDEDRELLGIQ